MKILQLVQQPQRRGAEIFAYQLSDRFQELGHQVKTVYLYSAPPDNPLTLREGDVIAGRNPRHFSERIPGWNPGIIREILRILTRFQPEIIQLNGARTVKYGAILRMMNRRAPWCLVYRNIGDPMVWQKNWLKRKFFKHVLFSRIDGMVAVNPQSFQSLKSMCPLKQIRMIPRAVDPKFFSPSISSEKIRELQTTPESAPVIIYVGSLTEEKRIDRLIDAFCFAARTIPALQLWIVGSGPLEETLRRQVKETGFADAIHFLGSLQDVASYVNAADLLLNTSDTEGIPGVILEAALVEVPSIASNVGGVSECIVDQQTGILIHSKEPEEFGRAIVELLQCNDRRLRMGREAKQWILSNFSLQKVAIRYLEFYAKILDQSEDSAVRTRYSALKHEL